jgi:hypothetical protein
VVQQHAQRDAALLVDQFEATLQIASKDFYSLQLGRDGFDLLDIVKCQFPLFDELHARNGCDHLGARGQPEHGIRGHGAIRNSQAPATRGVAEYDVSIAIDCAVYQAGDCGRWAGRGFVEVLSERSFNRCGEVRGGHAGGLLLSLSRMNQK